MTDDAAEFDAGLAGAGHSKAAPGVVAGERVTMLGSWWHTRRCSTCGHTFRRGDNVLMDEAGGVKHQDPVLRCAVGDPGDPSRAAGTDEFAAGIAAVWPVGGGRRVTLADDEPDLLLPPVGSLPRKACLFCGHTFRPGEYVVVCPCRPGPRHCAAAVHRDPAQGLVCWENWQPDGRIAVCPVTLRRLED